MRQSDFDEMAESTFETCLSILKEKGNKRNDPIDVERLAQFYRIAKMRDCSLIDAVTRAGMDKHLTIIYHYIKMAEADQMPDLQTWDASIFDAINYLVLLRAVVLQEWSRPPSKSGIESMEEGLTKL